MTVKMGMTFFMKAVIAFVVAVLLIINIFLIYSTNNLEKEIDDLQEELDTERLETEKLRQRMEKDMTDEQALIEEAKEQGYSDADDIRFEVDLPNA